VRPENDEIGVFHRVFEKIIQLRATQSPVKSIGMDRSPVPPLPAVRVVKNIGEPEEVKEPAKGASFVSDVSPGMMGRCQCGDGRFSIGFLNSFNLLRDDVQRFVPANSDIRRFAPVLRMTISVRIEIDSLPWISNPILGIGPVPLDKGVGTQSCLPMG
jgi:hypothetical protein